jgi:hypothetical protein
MSRQGRQGMPKHQTVLERRKWTSIFEVTPLQRTEIQGCKQINQIKSSIRFDLIWIQKMIDLILFDLIWIDLIFWIAPPFSLDEMH